MSKKRERIELSGGDDFGQSPFEQLSGTGLPEKKENLTQQPKEKLPKSSKANRWNVRIEKAGRGGKIVTILELKSSVNPNLLKGMLPEVKRRFGCGGKQVGKTLELQGDLREPLSQLLEEKGDGVTVSR